jgi:signal transduction histidine kinase
MLRLGCTLSRRSRLPPPPYVSLADGGRLPFPRSSAPRSVNPLDQAAAGRGPSSTAHAPATTTLEPPDTLSAGAIAELRARQQTALAELGVRALSGLSVPDLLADAVAVVAESLDTELVKIVELQPDRERALLVAGTGWKPGIVGAATISVGRDSQAGYALLSHGPVVVDDLNTESRLTDPPLLREHGVVSGMSVILYGPEGSAYGVLGAHTARHRRFSLDDVSFLQGVSNVVSAALHHRHVEGARRAAQVEAEAYAGQLEEQATELEQQAAELEQQVEEAQALAEELELTNEQLQAAAGRAERLLAVAAGLSGATTREQVADVIFREGLVALGADAGSLALVVPAGSTTPGSGVELEILRSIGYPEAVQSRYRRFPLTPGRPLSDAVLARTPRLLGSWDEWLRAYPDTEADLGAMGYEAFAAIPVLGDGRVLAALSASFRQPVSFDDATRTFLATLGEQCGLALARAGAYEAERRAREASAFLAEASQLLAASLDYETTLRAVAAAVVPRLGDWCAVDIVLEPTTPTWPPVLERLAMVHQEPEKLSIAATLTARYPTDWSAESGMAAVVRDGTPLFLPVIEDALIEAGARDAEHLALLRALALSSIIVVPLIARGHTLGALTICHTESGRHYDAADLALAVNLAQRAALAVDSARLYRDAELARASAEEANRGKSQFLATMSHELRTPLNAIAGHVQLLELGIHGPVTEAQQAALTRVDRAQHHLLGLINDVLNYARIESARVEYDVQPVRVDDVVRDVWPMVEPQLSAKGLTFHVRLSDHSGGPALTVWADREKLAQILLNLLSNAVKFTSPTRDGLPGRVTVELPGHDGGDGAAPPDQVFLRVTDSGVGIPAAKLDAVFEPFVQVQSELTRAVGGTGLGLTISRDLARGMGGDLRVESTEGVGSTFTLVLRRVVSASGAPVDRRTHDERRSDEERRLDEARRSIDDRRDG